MTTTHTRRTRPGLTLVELLVAMALSVGIVLILSESFKMGLDFARHAHVVGEQMQQLNGAGQVVIRDLQADHFEQNDGANQGVRLSDQRLDLLAPGGNLWTPPKGGYFRIVSPQPQYQATDGELFNINTASDHRLRFTAVLPGGTDQNLFTAQVGGQTYSSRAAEVAYFLTPMPFNPTTSPGPAGRPLYNLIRRQRLVAMNAGETAALVLGVADPEVIAGNGTAVYTLADVTDPNLRMPPAAFPPGHPRFGEDIVLSNVLSFEVLPEWERNQAGFTNSTQGPRVFGLGAGNNTDAPHDFLARQPGSNPTFASQGVFDTWYRNNTNTTTWNQPGDPACVPMAVRIKSIQFSIRVYDPRTKVARQNTWKIAM